VSCELWKHHSRFRSRQRKTPHGIVWEFDPLCRDCEQIERNERRPPALDGIVARCETPVWDNLLRQQLRFAAQDGRDQRFDALDAGG